MLLGKQKERTFCGKNYEELDELMNCLWNLTNDTMVTEKEEEALAVALQCMMEIANRMTDGKKIRWD